MMAQLKVKSVTFKLYWKPQSNLPVYLKEKENLSAVKDKKN